MNKKLFFALLFVSNTFLGYIMIEGIDNIQFIKLNTILKALALSFSSTIGIMFAMKKDKKLN